MVSAQSKGRAWARFDFAPRLRRGAPLSARDLLKGTSLPQRSAGPRLGEGQRAVEEPSVGARRLLTAPPVRRSSQRGDPLMRSLPP